MGLAESAVKVRETVWAWGKTRREESVEPGNYGFENCPGCGRGDCPGLCTTIW